jgi:predicted acylesterase/phospholipase RssA
VGPLCRSDHGRGNHESSAAEEVRPGRAPPRIAEAAARRLSRLRSLIERHLDFELLEQSPIPLHLVAVDVRSGREVRLSQGGTLDAILASAAVPAIFPAVRIAAMELVDGGVANHTPISHAVELGATTVYLLPMRSSGRHGTCGRIRR